MDWKTGKPDHIEDALVQIHKKQWFTWTDSSNKIYANLRLTEKIGVGGELIDNPVTELPTEKEVNDKTLELDTLKANATTNATKIADLEKEVNDKSGEITALKATAATNATKIADLEKQAKTDTDTIAQLNADIANKDADIQTKEQEIATLTNEKQGLDGQLKTVTQERDSLQTDLQTKTDELQTKTEEASKLSQTILDKDAEIKAKQDEIDKLKTTVADKNKDIAGLEKDINKLVPKHGIEATNTKEDLEGAFTYEHLGEKSSIQYVGTKNGLFIFDKTTKKLTKQAGFDSIGDMSNGFMYETNTKATGHVIFIGTKNGL